MMYSSSEFDKLDRLDVCELSSPSMPAIFAAADDCLLFQPCEALTIATRSIANLAMPNILTTAR